MEDKIVWRKIPKRENSYWKIQGGGWAKFKMPEWYDKSRNECKQERKCYWCWEICLWTFCCPDCRNKFNKAAWLTWLGTFRRELHKKFWFICQWCWKVFKLVLESWIELPQFKGEAHHKNPLQDWWEDDFDWQELLCHECHWEEHPDVNFFKNKKKNNTNKK